MSGFFIVFFLFCLAQHFGGHREDWPFSFFGMYGNTIDGGLIYRYDLEYLEANKEPVNLYARENGYYLFDRFNAVVAGERLAHNNAVLVPAGEIRTDPETISAVRNILITDALPILKRKRLGQPDGRLRVRYRRWVNVDVTKDRTPQTDVVILETSLRDLRGKQP